MSAHVVLAFSHILLACIPARKLLTFSHIFPHVGCGDQTTQRSQSISTSIVEVCVVERLDAMPVNIVLIDVVPTYHRNTAPKL